MKSLILILCLSSMVAAQQSSESRAFWRDYERVLEKQIQKIPKGTEVKVELRDGTFIYGTFKSFQPYNESIWINTGHLLDEGYGIGEVLDVTPGERI